ncbi:MAG: DUF362 domain-containing protein [Desulfobacteraceae bacterium]|nr:DUF362 domain-containing protein [Desulfobacteraceae bacterium]MBC2754581.1 DUF362 domain-containing protein [Desulfobacteraceae bacterium]
MSATVSIVKYASSPDSLKKSIELCDGFKNLTPSDRVMIKPNLVAWDDQFSIAPFGVYTTTRLVEDLIICLKDFGCNNITIGEGSVQLKKDMGTFAAFEGLGYKTLEKKYGINLVDFNESKAEEFTYHGDNKLFIAKEAVENDYFINFPVLKTHGQTRISLGFKNLKGCLKLKSKRNCHNPESGLEFSFSHIADFVKPSLTIIDGIFALEKGALHYGKAYRKDVVIASRDILAADLIGAQTIGYAGKDIDHFKYFAKRHNKSLAIDDYDIKGENINDHIQPLKWDWTWTKDNTGPAIFEKLGVTGVALPKYDDTLCSGCSPIANLSNILVLSAFKGQPLPHVEILNGKKMQGRPGYDKTVLLGNCMIKANKDNENINEAVKVKGCPPSENDVVEAMKDVGLDVNVLAYHGYMKQQSEKYNGKEGYAPEFFSA